MWRGLPLHWPPQRLFAATKVCNLCFSQFWVKTRMTSFYFCSRRKDLQLKDYKQDILLITGVLGSYANVVEKLHRDLDKNKATLLKIERAGDVLSEAVRFSNSLCYRMLRSFSKRRVGLP